MIVLVPLFGLVAVVLVHLLALWRWFQCLFRPYCAGFSAYFDLIVLFLVPVSHRAGFSASFGLVGLVLVHTSKC